MGRQKEAFEQRYAVKMSKILTKLSKETDKARVQAASAKTSPFKVRAFGDGRRLRQKARMVATGASGRRINTADAPPSKRSNWHKKRITCWYILHSVTRRP